jgi:hypothetical protein
MTDWAPFYDDTRADWNARPPTSSRTPVSLSSRTSFFNHYIGPGSPGFADRPHADCLAQVRSWQGYHQSKGWKDIGYNALICQHGRCIEGRGLGFSGSHCPNHNTSGIGVQFMVAGTEVPTPEAYARMRRLYDELVDAKGGALSKKGHRDGVATSCPGDIVYAWVKAGMPYPPGTSPTPTPAPAPSPAKLEVDGRLGPATIKRWQQVMGTTQDGVISRPSELVRKVQRHLVSRGASLAVDGYGIQPNTSEDYGPTQTLKALQRYLGTTADGILSNPSSNAVKALQTRLNGGKF